ncbi:hypothetical protein [Psychrobacillus sp. NPDC096623]|uniref:hypothetical protein n=1 Tax=Psychrobacillus sp. NPDC096623 TaxID=3364492 RepID=UPI0038122053
MLFQLNRSLFQLNAPKFPLATRFFQLESFKFQLTVSAAGLAAAIAKARHRKFKTFCSCASSSQ